jgi:predicted SAM-dependent methyltransferase
MQGHKYVQYGCGPFSAPGGWLNFDASPTLKLQLIPVLGRLLAPRMHVSFAPGIRYGDILEGLPVTPGSCKGVYCSHVLEHLSYEDCRTALVNTYRLLEDGGRFRCVLPDLECAARRYIQGLDGGDTEANTLFLEETMLGKRVRVRGIKNLVQSAFGNRDHQYMWDHPSLAALLKEVGFRSVRHCAFNDSGDAMFEKVEEEIRFQNAVALEAIR